ncbi:MAG: DsbA family protein [Candidatus Diapherotrites archaeon]|nr:DsbA family protein [Candidatus Diapherotrites archaeon]
MVSKKKMKRMRQEKLAAASDAKAKSQKSLTIFAVVLVAIVGAVWLFSPASVPKVSIDDPDPSFGPVDAKVEIVEFSDFQCPYCAASAVVVSELKEIYADKSVRFVYKDFPLPFHEYAMSTAMAAECADEQGNFWDFHDLAFANQDRLNKSGLIEYAGQAGLDTAAFEECLTSQKYSAEVDADIQEGTSLGVNSTPTFFINGSKFEGARTVEGFRSAIDAALR